MTRHVIVIGSVTKTLKAREILRKNQIKAFVEKTVDNDKKSGCGYALVVDGALEKTETLLKNNGIRILRIEKRA